MDYEVFISYKCSDEQGNKTLDFAIAQELYFTLTNMGYNTFFSSNTLEQIGSSRYKADIDSALDTAKVMIVVLSKEEYALSQWVQYEWDSFYNDYLSGVRKDAYLFTLTTSLNVHKLPRTLRIVQNFDYKDGLSHICEYIKNVIPKTQQIPLKEKRISIIMGREATIEEIKQIVLLDALAYNDTYQTNTNQCEEWFEANPDIYVLAKDIYKDSIVAYTDITPISDGCYDLIKQGEFIDTNFTADMILSYDMPGPYNLYLGSIVIHPDYQNTEVFMEMFNAIIDKFIKLGEQEVFVRRILADAVTKNGEKFCKLFGMTKVNDSFHNSSLYEVSMIPPKFRILSKKTKELYTYYREKYDELPYLFSEN